MGDLLTQFMNKYAYTDFHELNADWMIRTMMELINQVENFVSLNAIKYADPIQWNITKQYEKNTVVIDPLTGTAYISVQPVPMGVALTNADYWTVVFDLGSFVTRSAANFTPRIEENTTLTATFASNAGDWLIWGDVLYKVISPIVAGDSYVINSNIQHFTMNDIYDELVNAITYINTRLNNKITLHNDGDNVTATFASNKDSWLLWHDDLYLVIAPIAIGDTYTIGTNIQSATIESIVTYIATTLKNGIDYVNTHLNDKISIHNDGDNVTATFASSVNDWLIWQDNLYIVSAPIAIGDTYTVGTNLTAISIEDVISAVNGNISSLNTRVTTLERYDTFDFSNCLFIGDSFFEGGWLQPNEKFAYLFSQKNGITNYRNYGYSGAGLIGQNVPNGTFFDILQNIIIPNESSDANDISFILVECGANDGSPTVATYAGLTLNYINALKSAFPNAKIVFMYTPVIDVALNNTVLGMQRGCTFGDVFFVNSSLWLTGNTDLEDSNAPDHPNATGMNTIASFLTDAFKCGAPENYFEGYLEENAAYTTVTISRKQFYVHGDTLTMIVQGGINNDANRYVPVIDFTSHFYNHIPRFIGTAFTDLAQPYPIYVTQTGITLDTLVSTPKSTGFQFCLDLNIPNTFGNT